MNNTTFKIVKDSFSVLSPPYAPSALTRRGDTIIAKFALTDVDLCRSDFITVDELQRMILNLIPEARILSKKYDRVHKVCRFWFRVILNDFCDFLRDTRVPDMAPETFQFKLGDVIYDVPFQEGLTGWHPDTTANAAMMKKLLHKTMLMEARRKTA